MNKIIKTFIAVVFFISLKTGAQNWAPVPCFDGNFQVARMFVDSLQDEIILSFTNTYSVCGVNFKGCLAYNKNGFHDLDFGIDLHNSINPVTGGDQILGSVPYNNKSLMYGYFASVGSSTLPAEALALWDGAHWSNFPKNAFRYDPQRNLTQIVGGLYKDNSKIWIYGQYDSIGGMPCKNVSTFNGNSFTPVSFPANIFDGLKKMIRYKSYIVTCGSFFNQPYNSYSRIAKFDGTNWSPIGNGVQGAFDGISDMIVFQDTLYLAGSMNKANGNAGTHIMKWDGTTLMDAGFGNWYGTDLIKQLVVYRNRLYAFGNFQHAANQKSFGIAYYEKGKWTVPQDSIDNSINSAVVYHDELYIAGGFWSIGGDPSIKYFAKLKCPDFDAANGCISSVEDNSLKHSSLKVYPNPASRYLTIDTENIQINKINYAILNSLGQNILSGQLEIEKEKTIDVSNLKSGIYLLNIHDKTKILTSKFIKSSE
jgi:hypothetical protein